MTSGGYYVLTPLASTGSTEITAYTSGGTQAYDVTIPSPPNGPGSFAVNWEISYARTLVYDQTAAPYTGPNVNGSTVISYFILDTFAANDTPATQNVTQYQTTIRSTLNGAPLSSQTVNAAFGSSSAQNAIAAANVALSSRGASASSPALVSNSSTLTGSAVTSLETGDPFVAILSNPTAVSTFGAIWVPATTANTAPIASGFSLDSGPFPLFVFSGQLDISATSNYLYDVNRTVTTTNTYLTAQTYQINGFTSVATPEPASMLLVAAGLAILKLVRRPKGSRC